MTDRRNPTDDVTGGGARLVLTRVPSRPEGVVLLLHGGGGQGVRTVAPTQPSVLRMWLVAGAAVRAARGRLVVARLLNARRGWGGDRNPLQDAHWAIDRLVERFGEAPVSLVGHSLGGRAALLTAGRPEVRSVVAMAAWLQPGDGAGLRERRVLYLHGTHDRIAPIERAEASARDVARTSAVTFVRLEGAGHALVREARSVDRIAADLAVSSLLGTAPRQPLVARALAGEAWIDA